MAYEILIICFSKNIPAGTQCSWNICWAFPQRCNVRGIQGAFREHFKGKYFFEGKVVPPLKVYDLIITNVDLLGNSSNHKVMFPENSRNISRMSVSKSFQRYSRNILRLWKCFCELKKSKKLFYGLSWEMFNIGSLISWMFFWPLLKPFFI